MSILPLSGARRCALCDFLVGALRLIYHKGRNGCSQNLSRATIERKALIIKT